jgi:uncharacterized protein YkwD
MKSLLFSLLLPLSLFSQSPDEKVFIDEINRVRTHPQEYAQEILSKVENLRKLYGDDFAKSALETANFLKSQKKISPLKFDSELRENLENHGGIDTLKKQVDHDISCVDRNFKAENIAERFTNPKKAVLFLVIDHGIEGKGHRKAILNQKYSCTAVRKVVMGSGKFSTHISWIQELASEE